MVLHELIVIALCIIPLLLNISGCDGAHEDDEIWKGHTYPNDHFLSGIEVPFYMYSGGNFDVYWNHCRHPLWSKGVEISWLKRLRHHPWRTKDPDEAMIFVIPAMFSTAVYNVTENGFFCDKSPEYLSHKLYRAVHESPYYKRNWGQDHMVVISYFKGQAWVTQHAERWKAMMANMTVATHVVNNHYLHIDQRDYNQTRPPCRVSVGHQTGNISQLNLPVPKPDEIKHTFFFLGQSVGANYYRERRIAMNHFHRVGTNNFIVASQCEKMKRGTNLAGGYPECTEEYMRNNGSVGCCMQEPMEYKEYLNKLVHANFSLNIRGGDAGSSRTFDAILVGTPQLIVSDAFLYFYAPFPCVVPWWRFVKTIRSIPFSRYPVKFVNEALTDIIPRRTAMKVLQDFHKRDLLWTAPDSLSANNLLVQVAKQCLPKNPLEQVAASKTLRHKFYTVRSKRCVR